MALNKLLYYANGMMPLTTVKTDIFKYHCFWGIPLGTALTLQGFFITFFFSPINEPIKTRGEEQHTHNRRRANKSVNLSYFLNKILTAAEDFSIQNIKLIAKNMLNANAGYRNAVRNEFMSQSLPCNIL
jgi:hypothetical protein